MEQLRRLAHAGNHGLLSLAGMIVLFVLRKLTGDLFQRHDAGADGLIHVLAGIQLGKERILTMGKSGGSSHILSLNSASVYRIIVPACRGFVN